MEVPVTASLGPMDRLLRRLRSFEASQHNLPEGVSEDKIQNLKQCLEGLYTYLKDVPEAEDPSFTPKWWMKEVRELCYDTEDYFDEVMQSGAGASAGAGARARRSARLNTIFRISSKRKRRLQTAKDFAQLMARVDDARERCQSFQLAPETIKPDGGQAGVSPELPVSGAPISVPGDAGFRSIVGVEEPMNNLVKLLAFDDAKEEQLKVVPILGFPGVGKTTLARTLYHNFRGKFQCRAFLRISRNPDMRKLLTSTLSQIKAPPAHASSDAQDLIDNIIKHLQGKRYLLIIDDLWTASVWDIICRAFPYGNCCSRIITTTQIEDVALACCGYQSEYIFKMRPLSYGESRKLFFNRVFGSKGEGGCPRDFEEVSGEIIKKCGGLPLSTVNVASLLPRKPNAIIEQWEKVRCSLPFTVRTNPTSEGTKEVLNLIYNNLPPHLKTCLLYLSMYPEGYTVRKDDLVKQWVAECFLYAVEGQETKEIAGGYFDELVRRGMIQPVDRNYNCEVLSCTLHHMVFDLIVNKSMEENFIITVDYFQSTIGLPDKVRRLSVQFGGARSANIPASIMVSEVRSLGFFGFFKCVPSIVKYKLLRVLILYIWADQDKTSFDLIGIDELLLLRYLKIECNITVKLPDKIQGLQYLEALEVDATVAAIPSDICHLEQLLHLRLPSEAKLPHGVGDMTSLRTLGYFDLKSYSEDNVLDLGKLTDLQDLQLTCLPSQNLVFNMKHLGSIIGKFNNLQSLTLDGGPSSMSISCDGLSSVSPAPSRLQRLELLPRVCIFPSIPEWFQGLGKLSILKIAVRGLSTEDIVILQRLPALTALSLYVWTAPEGWIIFDNKGFPLLKYFKFMCTAPYLSFVEGAMPNVRKLKLGFNANRMKRHRPVTFGFRHLTGLREISVKFGGAGADEPDKMTAYLSDMAAAVKHPVNVKFVDRTFFGEEDKSSVTKEQEHEIQEHKNSKTEHSDEDVDKQVESGVSMPSESSSHRQNPIAEHKTVAIAMEDAIVSASTGAMNSVLRKLATLMGDEYANLRGTLEKVRILKDELYAMNALLEKLTDMSELNMQMRDLRNQMRELTYDIENCIDGLMLQFDKDIHQATTGYPAEKWDVLQQFIDQIRNLTAQVGRADLPSMLHSTGIRTLGSGYMVTEYDKVIGLVGIDGPRHELVRQIIGGEQQLMVACIWGSDGLGKTTLATEVYNQIKGRFDYQEFITVPQNRKVNITMIVRRHRLLQKRYLIVFDSVWSAQAYEDIIGDLPKNNLGSRIIMTTNNSDVAESCVSHSSFYSYKQPSGFIYRVEPLPAQDSLSLFRRIIFGSQKSCPIELQKVAKKILEACGGIPLAIIIIASLLASKPAEVAQWEMVEKCIEPSGKGDLTTEERVRKIFHASYSDLPRHMRTCLLYLSVFPENHVIRKDRLIWRWIAEGFIPRRGEESPWETGESYFQELIARNLIEPVYNEVPVSSDDVLNDEVPGCKVHGLILELITSLSNEENLVTSDAEATRVQHDVIRRLTVSSRPSTEHLSNKLRSLTIIWGSMYWWDAPPLSGKHFLVGLRFLRVLDLEDAKDFTNHHLIGIGGLVLLTYLGLRGTSIRYLPEEIGGLQRLEALDLRQTRLQTLPASAIRFPKLLCLLLDAYLKLTTEIWEMQELEEVSIIRADSSSLLNLVTELLSTWKRLKILGVSLGGNIFSREMPETYGRSVMSFLKELANSDIHSLYLSCGYYDDRYLLGFLLDSSEFSRRHFRRFELKIRPLEGRVPPKMAYLVNLTHLHIHIEVEMEGLRILGSLPYLVLLDLSSTYAATARVSCIISGDAFRCLKYFRLSIISGDGQMGPDFRSGAMPQLRRLWITFKAVYGDSVLGIQHLTCLTRVYASIDCYGATVSEVQAAEAAITEQVSHNPNRPTLEMRRSPWIV